MPFIRIRRYELFLQRGNRMKRPSKMTSIVSEIPNRVESNGQFAPFHIVKKIYSIFSENACDYKKKLINKLIRTKFGICTINVR